MFMLSLLELLDSFPFSPNQDSLLLMLDLLLKRVPLTRTRRCRDIFIVCRRFESVRVIVGRY